MMKNVVVYGDGIIGKLTAIALSDYFNVYVISSNESKTANNKQDRYFSINLLSKFMFIKYGLWEDIHKYISKGYNKIVTWHESLNEDVIFKSSDISFDKLGYIIKEDTIKNSLDHKLSTIQNIYLTNTIDCKIDDINVEFKIKSSYEKENLSNNKNCNFSKIDYDQKAIVLNLTCDLNNDQDTAFQRFQTGEVQGLLPISRNQYNLIWSAENSIIDNIKKLDDKKLITNLNKSLEDKIGKITHLSERTMFPLIGYNSKKYLFNDIILIGGAAHSVHPLAGLGLNMGIQDIFILTRCIEKYSKYVDALKKYERICVSDNNRFYRTINSLIKFYLEETIPNIIRNKSLSLFNKNKLIKRKAIEIATGIDKLSSLSKDEYCKPSY
ncbi:MAG: FAD-dependent monooxygenase [Pseudomonadota bacterium]|nr:FAD-dependent monooxygenase [Pseudomonadota bacterium]